MRGHSIELRSLQARNPSKIYNEAPEAYSSVSGFFSKADLQVKSGLRRCQSASALAKRPKSCANQGTQRLSMLQTKYRALQEDYRRVLQEVKSRGELYTRQKDEIERLTQVTIKEEKQIERLRQLLRMSEKKNQCVQTEQQFQLEDSSWRKRIQVSTGESELTSQTRCERGSIRRQSQSKERIERKNTIMVEKQRMGDSRLLRTNGKQRAPLTKKYKFIPTLSFKHI